MKNVSKLLDIMILIHFVNCHSVLGSYAYGSDNNIVRFLGVLSIYIFSATDKEEDGAKKMNLHFTFSVREVSEVTDADQTLKIQMYLALQWEVGPQRELKTNLHESMIVKLEFSRRIVSISTNNWISLVMKICHRQEVRLLINKQHFSWEDDSTGPKGENTEEVEVSKLEEELTGIFTFLQMQYHLPLFCEETHYWLTIMINTDRPPQSIQGKSLYLTFLDHEALVETQFGDLWTRGFPDTQDSWRNGWAQNH